MHESSSIIGAFLSQQSFHAELWIHALFILNSTAEMQHFVQWLQYADS